jgi:ribonuclease-3
MKKPLGQLITFDNPDHLQQALTHRSASKRNNERLEFLGDSILGLVITRWLYNKFPSLSEGKLSRMRSSLVKGETLAEIARFHNLGKDLILGIGELKSGGFNRSSVLADAVEAIFGAVLLDKGIAVAEEFILAVMHNWLIKVDPETSDKDAKTLLQEYLQSQGYKTPEYSLLKTQGKDHLQTFTIQCLVKELNLTSTGQKRSRKKAEQMAAKNMLEKINQS